MKDSKFDRLEARARKLMAAVDGTDNTHTEKSNTFLHRLWGGTCRPWMVMPLKGEKRHNSSERPY